MKDELKIIFITTAFLLLASSLTLSFKNNGKLGHGRDLTNMNFAASGYTVTNTTPLMIEANNYKFPYQINWDKMPQKGDGQQSYPSDMLKKMEPLLAKAMATKGGMCGSSSGSIGVSHGLCQPPGPGKWSGHPDKPGTDLRPCPVSGTQGGSIVAVCLSGCCVKVSATAGGATAANESGIGSGMLQGLGAAMNIFGQFMQMGGGGGGSAGTYPYTNRSEFDNTEINIQSDEAFASEGIVTENSDNTEVREDEYINPDVSYQDETQSQNIGADSVLTDIIKERENKNDTSDNIRKPIVNQVFSGQSVKNEENMQFQEDIDNVYTREYYFQNKEKEALDDPRLAYLRDPSKSKVFQHKESKEEKYPIVQEERGFFSRIIDSILSIFGL